MADTYYGSGAEFNQNTSWKDLGIMHGSASPFSYKRYGSCTDLCLGICEEDEGLPWTYVAIPVTPAVLEGQDIHVSLLPNGSVTEANLTVTVNPSAFIVLVEAAEGTDLSELYLHLYIR